MQVDILAIGVHPDDVELGCAGTLLSHAASGHSFGILDLTRGELGTRGSADLRDQEAANSAKLLGAKFRKNTRLADGFFENDKESRQRIIEVLRWCKPKIVLANALSDRHPDHGRAAKLIADACFYSGLAKIPSNYEGQSQERHRPDQVLHYIQDYFSEPHLVVDISDHIEQKIESIQAFSSQFHDPNSAEPETPLTGSDFFDFIKARAKELGRPAGYAYAEGFHHSRRFGVNNLFHLD